MADFTSPSLFSLLEIPDFLREDECKLLIHLAQRKGLHKSSIAFSKDRADYLEKLAVKQVEIFNYLDLNQDGQLQMIEVVKRAWFHTPVDIYCANTESIIGG